MKFLGDELSDYTDRGRVVGDELSGTSCRGRVVRGRIDVVSIIALNKIEALELTEETKKLMSNLKNKV